MLRPDVLRELDTSHRFVSLAEQSKAWKDGLERYARQACDALGIQRRGVHGFRATVPVCPKCGSPLILRIARRGDRAGRSFHGCSTYPKCTGIVTLGEAPFPVVQ